MNIRRLLLMMSLSLAFIGFSTDSMTATSKTSALSYHDQWRSLWEEHISWTRSVIFLILDGPTNPDVDALLGHAYVTRLLKNYEDMEDALSPYYKQDDVEELGDLIKDHLVIAAGILIAEKTVPFNEAATNSLIASWYVNGEQIAAKMAEMNPRYWPESMGSPMWKDHLDQTLAEAVAHLTGDTAAEVVAVDKVHSMALEMADFFSAGVIRQFNGKFAGAR